ncbi:hypothetical protein [Hymenobacter nivis]|uniref:Uncharacterized protein n=1 Tax=Hymenobacter nivis TaxID=1850093 RepID=A0A2Z3GMF4_9BACT|nr:hypothetical protein [Hymenobacter nivis]AWM32105.1 hypothetical protein DDQ68_04420 [Hymenobacter nivis]
MEQLLQKTLTSIKTVRITPTGLRVQTKNLREELDYTLQFDDLGFDTVRQRVKSANLPFYCFLVFDGLYVWLLVTSVRHHEPFKQQLFWLGALLFFSALTGFAFFHRNKDVVHLTGGARTLELLATRPDAPRVALFIAAVHQAMRDYHKARYAALDAHLPYAARLGRLQELRERHVVSDEEYRTLRDAMHWSNVLSFPRLSDN